MSCSGTECNHICSWLGFRRHFFCWCCHSMPLVLFLNSQIILDSWISWKRVANTTHESHPRIFCFVAGGATNDKIDPVLLQWNHSENSPQDRKTLILKVAIISCYITSNKLWSKKKPSSIKTLDIKERHLEKLLSWITIDEWFEVTRANPFQVLGDLCIHRF